MRTLITSICLSTAFFFWIPSQVTAATTDFYGRSLDPYQWQIVGNNPCKGTDLCTDSWALDQAERNGVFPPAVAEQFRHKLARGDAPTYSQVCPGDQFFISFVKKQTAQFTPFAMADFADGQCRTTKVWYVTDPATGWTYRYFTVLECGNKGGGIVTHLSEPVTSNPLIVEHDGKGDSSDDDWYSGTPDNGYLGGGSTSIIDVITHKDVPIEDPQVAVPPIPLPATFWLMLSVLGCLYLPKVLQNLRLTSWSLSCTAMCDFFITVYTGSVLHCRSKLHKWII